MTIEKKLLGTSPSGDSANVAEVFSTHLYAGNNSTQTITNGIDLSGEGGLVWIKQRTGTNSHYLHNTDMSASSDYHKSDSTSAVGTGIALTKNSNGFSIASTTWDGINATNHKYVSWTFRKKEKFFDVVTWSGNDVSGRTVAHDLGAVPAMMIVKCKSHTGDWVVYHNAGMGATKSIKLNSTDAQSTNTSWNNTAPTDSVFTVGGSNAVNGSGRTYIAYLFADNSSEDAEDQMIKCNWYLGNGSSTSGPVVNLGWEPQFVLIRNVSDGANWFLMDSMRGIPTSDEEAVLAPNNTNSESGNSGNGWGIDLTATGFKVTTAQGQMNTAGHTYIYMAIRAPMMKEPEAATEAFYVNASNGNGGGQTFHSTGFDVGMAITKKTTGGVNYISTRLTGQQFLRTEGTNVEDNNGPFLFDVSKGVTKTGGGGNGNDPYVTYAWKRAKGFMDVVTYNGNSSNSVVKHSLGAIPEMIIYKCRSNGASNRFWTVYHASEGASKYQRLNEVYGNDPALDLYQTTPTATQFYARQGFSVVNETGYTYIAYLFATLAGISKVGSYTGNGSYQTIPCGFSSGSRFVLIRRTDANGDWYYWDSARGIVAGNDPHASFNTSAAQVTNDDSIDPHNSGFIVNQVSATNINVSSGTYIFYAIA